MVIQKTKQNVTLRKISLPLSLFFFSLFSVSLFLPSGFLFYTECGRKGFYIQKHHQVVLSIAKHFKFNELYSFSNFIWTKIRNKPLSIHCTVRTKGFIRGAHEILYLKLKSL